MSELLDDENFVNWTKGPVALGITKSGVSKFVERTWKEEIKSWPEAEQKHISVFLKDIYFESFKMTTKRQVERKSKNKTKVQMICGHELCSKLADRLIPENPKHIDFKCDTKPGDHLKGEEWYWELAKLYMHGKPEETKCQTCPDNTEFTLVLKMVKNCFLFEKADEQYEKILNIRNALMHSPTGKLTSYELHGYVSVMKDFLKTIHENECQICEPDDVKEKCKDYLKEESKDDLKEECDDDAKEKCDDDVKEKCDDDAKEKCDDDVKEECKFQQEIKTAYKELDKLLAKKTAFERTKQDLELMQTALEEQRRILESEKLAHDVSGISSSTVDLLLEANEKRTKEYTVFITKFETIYVCDNPDDRKMAYEKLVEGYQREEKEKLKLKAKELALTRIKMAKGHVIGAAVGATVGMVGGPVGAVVGGAIGSFVGGFFNQKM